MFVYITKFKSYAINALKTTKLALVDSTNAVTLVERQ